MPDPSRPAVPPEERIPPTPSSAVTVFGDRLEVAEHYVALLATTGIDHGLVGPREAPRLWERHVLGCGVVAPLLGPSSTLADIGSGAGLPGLVLALARPDVTVTLVEPLHRRVIWLERAVTELGLGNVTVHEGRAESLWTHRTFDVVTARAVARIGVLAGWCLPLVAPGGRLLAIKGRSIEDELREDAAALTAAGADAWQVEQLGSSVLEQPATLAVLEVGDRTPSPVPDRRTPAKRPGAKRSTSTRRRPR
ncbi:16S rRNA (guanine(527)-N(7))-methyltransferase RsmG [Lapillicoccus jejuensis]|uniref:Ribosomal RNA small subunit methyltransferase G n=1 Tax=Lapillicoccus jejuensis TaxID=402171 RepID=A0A542DZ77_9MICO|nr:16S rRNA (guanine(527)-N(7))-methyltransferase RsmG [Lapillicoccus jejuensis]TQJ08356.1 16S rRNA m(7)G-527 methyltransferase [Lapillicoccus jejuensis]